MAFVRRGQLIEGFAAEGRTGRKQHETIPTPADGGNLQLRITVSLDEQVDAQPPFVPGETTAGGTHSVIYVATENGPVNAIDAATGAVPLRR